LADAPAIKAVLVDLDGTMLDTAPDLEAAANATLASLDLAPLAHNAAREFIGKGVSVFVRRFLEASLGKEPEPRLLVRAQTRFSKFYERFNGSASRPFPGVLEGLTALRAQRLAVACVTNKLMRFALPLITRSGLEPYIQAIVTSDTAGARKPEAAIMLHACALLGVSPASAWVIGDSDNDGDSARAAGCRFLLVPYGYREGRPVEAIACDAVVANLLEAAEYLKSISAG
jgi:phosphoglycolate phosphatase